MSLLTPVSTILTLLIIVPCSINYLTHFVSAQVNKLQNAVLVQQGYIKLYQPQKTSITHPQRDTTIRTLRLETSKRGSPMPLADPDQQEVARETSVPLIPKNWASHLLRGVFQVVRIGKRSLKWWWQKDKQREKPTQREQRKNTQTRVRTSGETNTPPSWLALVCIAQAQRVRRQNI